MVRRHLRPLLGLPGTELGVVSWPAPWQHRWWLEWHYWWQAHLVDCLVDAHLRSPTADRLRRLQRVVRSHRLRNLTGWTNRYHDDMAWLGLALERAGRITGVARPAAVAVLARQLRDHWIEPTQGTDGRPGRIGGLPWRRGSDFHNAPAAGPAAILLARLGERDRALAMAQWLQDVLVDPMTGLVRDGIHTDGTLVERPYTYCQGVVLGLGVELSRRTGDRLHVERTARLVAAVAEHLCDDGVVTDGGGGDGGLFNGILLRHLAVVAGELPGRDVTATRARATARRVVLASAGSAWRRRHRHPDGPVFGHVWTRPAPAPSPLVPERDLSVQLSGWMAMEAAARLH